MLEEVYQNLEIEDEKYAEGKRLARCIVANPDVSVLDEMIFQEEALTRKIEFLKVQVIPYCFYEEVRELWSSRNILSLPTTDPLDDLIVILIGEITESLQLTVISAPPLEQS